MNCCLSWIFNEGSESKNEGNSLAHPWPTWCFPRPEGYCRVLELDTKPLREHLSFPGGHLKRANKRHGHFNTERYLFVNNVSNTGTGQPFSTHARAAESSACWMYRTNKSEFSGRMWKNRFTKCHSSVCLKLHLTWLSDGFLKEEIKETHILEGSRCKFRNHVMQSPNSGSAVTELCGFIQ